MTAPGVARPNPSPPLPAKPAAPVLRAFVGRPTASPQAAASWTPRQVWANNLRSVVGRAYPRIIGLTREPSWLIFQMLLPFLTTSSFVFVYRALDAPQAYIGFVVIGGAMTAFWLNVVWMMAAQLYWEKDQGNLELYFAAPMNVMSVLIGMAVGGLVMSSTRAVAILFIATVVFGVSFSISQWALLIAVFVLTLAALYGFGMMLASLFVMWGREAFHLTQLMTEPVYFVSGPQLPGRPAGLHRRPGDRPHPAGRRPRRDAPAGLRVDRPDRHARAVGRGADPGRDDHRVHRPRPLAAPFDGGAGASRGPPDGALAMIDVGLNPRDRFDPARARGRGTVDLLRSFRTAASRWAGRWRPTGPTRSCSSSTRWPSRSPRP